MAIVTSTSDPTLWNKLMAIQILTEAGWVQDGQTLYLYVLNSSDGSEFHSKTEEELFDSRSIIGSRPASYTKLDNG